ncbi:hypothetical protein R3P38DRAFT_2786379 [Favolaschia claudopus]|uniref:Endonuclease/exonuclease/phosphatase domain-containing protein n=1 Tax=Favolaschia claudopus TaxID=2862362 RepID=A0AAW0AS85_9AGAR
MMVGIYDQSDEPRFDLLEDWIVPLRAARPDWEIFWQPQDVGKDKRSWVRIPEYTLPPKPAGPRPYSDDVIKEVEKFFVGRGVPVADVFGFAGGIIANVLDPKQADEIVSLRTCRIPSVPSRQVEIEHAFEIAICGIQNADGVVKGIRAWLATHFMRDWSSTARVLNSHKAFLDFFRPEVPRILAPRLLYMVNKEGVVRAQSVVDVVQRGARSVESTIVSLTTQLAELRREQLAHNNATTHQLASLQSQQATTTDHIKQLTVSMTNQTHALFALYQNQEDRSLLSSVQLQLQSERLGLRFLTGAERDASSAEITRIKQQEQQLMAKVAGAGSALTSIVGGRASNAIGAPPSTSNQPTTPPGLGRSPSQRIRERTSRSASPSPASGEARKRVRTGGNEEEEEAARLATEDSNVCDTTYLHVNCLIAARKEHETGLKSLCRPAPRTSTLSPYKGIFHGVLSFGSVVGVLKSVKSIGLGRTPPVDTPKYVAIQSSPSLLMILFLLATLINVVAAAPPASSSSTFSVYSVNVNGIGGTAKIHHLNQAILARRPHAFVISETKTNQKTGPKLLNQDYEIFEEPGVPMAGNRGYKWGVVVGIRKDVAFSQRIALPQASLRGRGIALDVVLPTNGGQGFLHRLIGTYAPWNPGGNGSNPEAANYWTELTSFVNSCTHTWTVAGDLNATITALERASDNSDARAQFLRFLNDCDAHDLWRDRIDRTRIQDWTSKPRGSSGGGSIIDRVVSSKTRLVDSEIFTADRYSDFIPSTDHRAVVARIIYAPPPSISCASTQMQSYTPSFPKPRINYPKRSEKHRFKIFRDLVDSRIQDTLLHETPVLNDDSFLLRYKELTRILVSSAEESFGRVSRFKPQQRTITSPQIQLLAANLRRIGGSIRYVKSELTAPLAHDSQLCYAEHLLAYSANPPKDTSFLQYLSQIRRRASQDLYREKMAEVYTRAKLQDKNRVAAALRGGSTKRLVNPSAFISMPLSVNKLDGSGELISDPEGVNETSRQYFQDLYAHEPASNNPKPWLQTPSVLSTKHRVEAEPFVWPRPIEINDFRALLRKGTDPSTVQEHEVALIQDGLDFLRTKVDDPAARFNELYDFIDSFSFPRFTTRAPFTLFRKIANQIIISRCRALLSLQPVSHADAERLDTRIAARIHEQTGMPYIFNSRILNLPIHDHGMGVFSVARINAGLVADGLRPHHILSEQGLSLRKTDHTAIGTGDISISHALKLCNRHSLASSIKTDGNTDRVLRSKGFRRLSDIGTWIFPDSGEAVFRLVDTPFSGTYDRSWTIPQQAHWTRAVHLLSQMQTDWLFVGAPNLLLSPSLRRKEAETRIHELVHTSAFAPSVTTSELSLPPEFWGSDGSMVAASASIGLSRSVTAAATGTSTLALRLDDCSAFILHGELMGLIMALVLMEPSSILFSDHLNSTRLIDDSKSFASQETRLRNMNGRSYYRWIFDLVKVKRASILYTPGHSSDSSTAATLNNEADFYASRAQRHSRHVASAPIPTFFMDEFTFYSHDLHEGWMEANIRTTLDTMMSQKTVRKLGIGNRWRMSTWIHDPRPPPEYPYTRATSAHSAVVQLYARSGQLPTAELLAQRSKIPMANICRVGCSAMETPHHLFIVKKTICGLEDLEIDSVHKSRILHVAKSLFLDDKVWPLGHTLYYLGQLPILDVAFPSSQAPTK